MITKIALLSNINMNFVIRTLQKEIEVFQAEGYGNELGTLMNTASAYYAFEPEITFMVVDLMELVEHELNPTLAGEKMDQWFSTLESVIQENCIYYISDAYLWGMELAVSTASNCKFELEWLWQERLQQICRRHANIRVFPYRRIIEKLGEQNAFSMKMWYMGKMLHAADAQKELANQILEKVRLENRTPKKLLLLDLDNTLWGGVVGEADHTPIVLSDDHSGLAYKNLQRMILAMQKQGVLLGIVSKNNEEDVIPILRKHPHMVLREECFAIRKINWKAKHENIEDISKELNLGLDSFVFFDDNPTEQELIREMLPEVVVAEFPKQPEKLCETMEEIYHNYFEKTVLTSEDLQKTKQYAENVKRKEYQRQAGSFESYLKGLQITMELVDARENIERLTQLLNKTNQFNLTTNRYGQTELLELLAKGKRDAYVYHVTDRFGDYGIVAAVLVEADGETAHVTDFVMSCRVMGKNIEDAILQDVEQNLKGRGFKKVVGRYLPTKKNQPVAQLYERLGYQKLAILSQGEADGGILVEGESYELFLENMPERICFVEKLG